MIVIIIALATVLTFSSWSYITSVMLRIVCGLASLFLLAFSIWLLTDHFVNHTGLVVKSETKTSAIYTAGDVTVSYGVLITKEIGTSSGNYVLVYRDKTSEKEATAHFVPDTSQVTTAIKKKTTYKTTTGNKAYLKTVTKRYRWQSKLDEWLFGFAGEAGELVSQKRTAYVPEKTWLVLTDKEAEKLEQLLPQLKEQAKSQQAANPQAYQALQALAKSNPEEYAAKQIEMIKKALK